MILLQIVLHSAGVVCSKLSRLVLWLRAYGEWYSRQSPYPVSSFFEIGMQLTGQSTDRILPAEIRFGEVDRPGLIFPAGNQNS